MPVLRLSTAVTIKLLLMFLFMALTATLAFHHEPWRDEVDSWMMARDASLSTIVKISPDMGTPVGWYFLLKPFASVGLPFAVQPVLTLVLIWTAVGILIFQSPFSSVVSASLCLSWFLSFEYSVVSRNYALRILGVFALFGSCSNETRSLSRSLQWWLSWPLILFSSVHFLSFAPGLMRLSYLQRTPHPSQRVKSLLLHLWPTCLTILSVWILWPTGHGQMAPDFATIRHFDNLHKAICMSVFPFFSTDGLSQYIAPLVFISCIVICMRESREAIALFLMFYGVNYIFVFKYFHSSLRYCGFNWIIFVTAAWLLCLRARKLPSERIQKRISLLTGLLLVITLINLPSVIKYWRRELSLPFTDAGATARYLIESNQLGEPIACTNPPLCTSILGYVSMPVRFWYPGIDQWGTHMFWDSTFAKSVRLDPLQAFLRARHFFYDVEGKDTFLFLSSAPISSPQTLGLTQLWESPTEGWHVTDERFIAYRWRADVH